ncbi:MAG: acetyl-CoA carboxylase biotin carboxyl carrier protein subunit [Bacteroidales bacterium]|nr:acetyl-CoA carboxylase biotin carboxyl carrier protein subunit [Bacteroidales bacterium]
MIEINVNNKNYTLDLKKNGSFTKGTINNNEFRADILSIDKNNFHLIKDNKSYNIEISEIDKDAKKLKLKINGKNFSVHAMSELDILLKEMGMDNLSAKKMKELKAPMPGLVLDVPVNEGDEIKKGDKLLVLEAMKMENNLKAEADAKIKTIKCKKGQAVEKNEVLIVFE